MEASEAWVRTYGTITVSSPASENVITPPKMHISCDTLSRVGIPPSRTVGAPMIHGAGVAGTHGIGVSTPKAAVVAAAVAGKAGDAHAPNGMIFTMGM